MLHVRSNYDLDFHLINSAVESIWKKFECGQFCKFFHLFVMLALESNDWMPIRHCRSSYDKLQLIIFSRPACQPAVLRNQTNQLNFSYWKPTSNRFFCLSFQYFIMSFALFAFLMFSSILLLIELSNRNTGILEFEHHFGAKVACAVLGILNSIFYLLSSSIAFKIPSSSHAGPKRTLPQPIWTKQKLKGGSEDAAGHFNWFNQRCL